MERLNIAFYTDAYLPGVDGVVTSILNSKKELEKRGHKVYIFASSSLKNKKKYEKENVFLYHGIGFKPYPQYNIALFPYASMFKLNELKIDIIHAHTPMVMGLAGLTCARLMNKPVVSSCHTFVTDKRVIDAYYPKNRHIKHIATKYMKRYTNFFYRNCNMVIAPTHTVASILRRSGISKVSVVPNSVDLGVLNPRVNGMRMRRKFGVKNNEKVILYLGRLSKEKQVEVLIRAAARLLKKGKKIRLVIGGTGPAEHHYKEMASSLGIMHQTSFIGFINQKDIPQVYAACDVLCLPSTFETQGIVLIEAMACGKPVVGADYLAIKEMIRNGKNGEKFRPGDAADCAAKIEKVLNHAGEYKQNAIDTAMQFSRENVADKLLDVYNLILSNKAIH